jgi:hypothetical protein
MGSETKSTHKLYINVMELLVAEEVGRQLERVSERASKYIKRTEVETFALNRLPALYASSEKGLQHQYDRALQSHGKEIQSAVRQAFAAVQVDPIRLSQPLHLNGEEEAVLQALRELLRVPNLSWKSALREIQKLQNKRKSKRQPPGSTSSRDDNSHQSQQSSPPPEADHGTTWRPGTYGSRIGWQPRKQHRMPEEGFDDNAR